MTLRPPAFHWIWRAPRQSRATHQRWPQGISGAIEKSFGADIDYAMLVKIYGEPRVPRAAISPADCTGAEKRRDTVGLIPRTSAPAMPSAKTSA